MDVLMRLQVDVEITRLYEKMLVPADVLYIGEMIYKVSVLFLCLSLSFGSPCLQQHPSSSSHSLFVRRSSTFPSSALR